MIRQAALLPVALRDSLAQADDTQPASHIIHLLRPWLRDTGWLDDAIAGQLALMAENPLHLPPARASRAGAQRHLVLANGPRLTLAVTLLAADKADVADDAPIAFPGQTTLTRLLPGAALEGTFFVHDTEGRARRAGDMALVPGAPLELDESLCVCRFRPGPHPVALLRATIMHSDAPLTGIHDPGSGACIARSSRDEEATRTLMLLSLLRASGRRDAAPLFEMATQARHPHQRWAAMREYLALDTAAAFPRLQTVASGDADVELRHLAQGILARIGVTPDAEAHPCLA